MKDWFHKNINFIQVDEYQDTNTAQFYLLQELKGDDTNLFVVGDDWQCWDEDSIVITLEHGEIPIQYLKEGHEVLTVKHGHPAWSKVTGVKPEHIQTTCSSYQDRNW